MSVWLEQYSPVSASINSAWPFPAIPAMPSTSPAWAVRFISCKAVSNGPAAGRFNPLIRKIAGALLRASGGVIADIFDPTINSANCLVDLSCVFTSAIFSPPRKIVARLVSCLISSNLCEMNRTAQPCPAKLARTSNNCWVSCGVRTEVGSSIISKAGSCNKQRNISTRCCSPTDRSATRLSGRKGMPYSVDFSAINSPSPSLRKSAGSARAIFSTTLRASNSEKC